MVRTYPEGFAEAVSSLGHENLRRGIDESAGVLPGLRFRRARRPKCSATAAENIRGRQRARKQTGFVGDQSLVLRGLIKWKRANDGRTTQHDRFRVVAGTGGSHGRKSTRGHEAMRGRSCHYRTRPTREGGRRHHRLQRGPVSTIPAETSSPSADTTLSAACPHPIRRANPRTLLGCHEEHGGLAEIG